LKNLGSCSIFTRISVVYVDKSLVEFEQSGPDCQYVIAMARGFHLFPIVFQRADVGKLKDDMPRIFLSEGAIEGNET
jgi:hypothetical protein